MPLITEDMFEIRYEMKKLNKNFRKNNNTSHARVLETMNQEAEDLKKDVMDLKVKVDIPVVDSNSTTKLATELEKVKLSLETLVQSKANRTDQMEAVTLESATSNEHMIMKMRERPNRESNIIILDAEEPNQQTLGNRTNEDINSTREILKEIDVDTSNQENSVNIVETELEATNKFNSVFIDSVEEISNSLGNAS
ncbi:hypothetical protein JTB14_023641 [Gonioctena quinquepunctata]|nr:hypothetical protein JTB14_023641 [Gonioctena quinquepunctata]